MRGVSGRSLRWTWRTLFALLAVALLVTYPAGTAAANPKPPDGAGHAAMSVQGFDAEVAQQNGYVIINSETSQFSIKQKAYDDCNAQASNGNIRASCYQAASQPQETLYGNCGDSYFYMSGTSEGPGYYWLTGFDLIGPAWEFSWESIVEGPNGYEAVFPDSGFLPGSHWDSGTEFASVPSTGYYYGSVYPPSSYAVLLSGAFCYSGGPTDDTTIY